jgi:hypothetical protein
MQIKNNSVKKIIILYILTFLITLVISCNSAEKKDIDNENIAATQNTEQPVIENTTDNPVAEEQESKQTDLESSDSDISELCYNPYIPMKSGTVWTYEIILPATGDTSQFTKTVQEIDSDTFVVTESYPGYTRVCDWNCTGDGIIQSEYTGFDTQNMPEGMEFNTIEFKGVTYPPADEWQVGKTWGMDYTISAEGDTESGEFTYDGHVIIENEIISEESVEVPAGIFNDALKVDSILKLDLVYKIQGVTQDMDIELGLSTWYAKDIGMIKQVSGPQDSASTTVLLSME